LALEEEANGLWRRRLRLCKAPVEDPKITQKSAKIKNGEKILDKKAYKRLEASFCLTEWEKTLVAIGCLLPVFDVVVVVWHVNGPLRID